MSTNVGNIDADGKDVSHLLFVTVSNVVII